MDSLFRNIASHVPSEKNIALVPRKKHVAKDEVKCSRSASSTSSRVAVYSVDFGPVVQLEGRRSMMWPLYDVILH
jgi:hypothetical protein